MLCIEQTLANKIAKQQKLSCRVMEAFFSCGQKKILEYEQFLYDEVYGEFGSEKVANAVLFVLPLFLESEAIARFLESADGTGYRKVLPVVRSQEQAVQLAQDVIPGMSKKEVRWFYQVLKRLHLHMVPEQYSAPVRSDIVLEFQLESMLSIYIRPPLINVYRNTAVPDLPEPREITADQFRSAAVDVTRHLIRRYGIKPQELK